MEPELDIPRRITDILKEMNERLDRLEAQENPSVIIKSTAGDPATGYTGQIVVNTNDNKIKMWGWGGWRQIFP